jgi:hypothetical protein
MSKYSPGPWFFTVLQHRDIDNFPVYAVTTDRNDIITTTVQTTVPGYDQEDCRQRVEANARLMAAAPELLIKARQLAFILRRINETNAFPGNDYSDHEKDVLDLLIKAEGKEK